MTSSKRRFASLFLAALLALPAAASLAQSSGSTFQLSKPALQIPIPEVNLTAPKSSADTITAPYLAQYVAGVYRFLLGVIGIVAAVSLMWGGFRYLTAGGDAGRVGLAKERIRNAILGLILAYLSYLVLYLVNPGLVQFKGLSLPFVTTSGFDTFDDYAPEVATAPSTAPGGSTGAKSASDPAYDAIFQKYAPCAGADWRVLKAIAYRESSLDSGRVNASGYTGLFQTKTANCQGALSGFSLASQCGNLTDPDVNTAVGARMLRTAINTIQARCPNAALDDQFTMVYINHNMGPGVLKYAANYGCDAASLRAGVIAYYQNVGASTAASYANKYQPSCLSQGKSAAECTGGPKFDFAQKTAQTMSQLGVSSLASPGGDCPLQ